MFANKTLPLQKNLFELWKLFGLIDNDKRSFSDEIKIDCLQQWCDILYPMKVSVNSFHTDYIMTSKIKKSDLYPNHHFPDRFCSTVFHISKIIATYDAFRPLSQIEQKCYDITIQLLKANSISTVEITQPILTSNDTNIYSLWLTLGPVKLAQNENLPTEELQLSVLSEWIKLFTSDNEFSLTKKYSEYRNQKISEQMKVKVENYPQMHISFEEINILTFIRDNLKSIKI